MEDLNWDRFYVKAYPGSFLRKSAWIFVIIISFVGLFYPYLGLFMPVMMGTLLSLSFFKGRFWCGNFCPRGSFLDFVFKPLSRNKKIPKFFRNNVFRISFLGVFFAVFGFRLYSVFSGAAGWTLLAQLGFLFATLCLVTTLIAMFFGSLFAPRTWCLFCPMGTMQKGIYKLGRGRR